MSSMSFDLNEIKVLINDAVNNGVIEKVLSEISKEDLERAIVEFGGLTDPIGQLESWLSQQLTSFGQWLYQQFETVITPVVNAISTVSQYVNSGFQQLSSVITQSFTSFVNSVSSALSNLQSAFQGLSNTFNSFVSSISNTLSSFQSALTNAFSQFGNTLSSFMSSISNALQSGFSAIQNALSAIGSNVVNTLNNVVHVLSSVVIPNIQNWINGIVSGIQNFASSVQSVFSQIGSYLSGIGNAISGFIGNLENAFGYVGKLITGFIGNLESGFADIGKAVQGFFSNIQQAFNAVGSFIAQGFTNILNAFISLGQGIQSVFNQILNVFTQIPQVIGDIPKQVFKAVYQAFTDFLKSSNLSEVITFFSNINKWIKSIESSPLINALETWGTDMESLFKQFYGYMQGFVSFIVNSVQGMVSFFSGIGKSLASGLQGFIKDITGFASGFFKYVTYDLFISSGIQSLLFFSSISKYMAQPYITIKSGVDPEKIAIPNLLGGIGAILGISLPFLTGSLFLGKLIERIGSAIGDQEVDLSPMGLGVRLRMALGKLLEPFGDAIDKFSDEIGRALVLSGSLAYLEPLRYISRYFWWLVFYSIGLGDIPLEIPAFHEVLDIARRYDITKMLNYVANTMIYRGYPYWLLSRVVALPQIFTSIDVANQALSDFAKEIQNNAITVVDKFGNQRIIPIAPLFDLPTTHDLVEFMLRDLFLPARLPPQQQPVEAYKSFVKSMWARGIPPDVAYMYYLRAYELPSATQVWDFTMRALSGFAWYVPPQEVIQFAQSEASIINAFNPEVPANLNFNYNLLLLALAEYQKWHGRAHFAWINDPTTGKSYTSDAWLIIDQSAHLLDRSDIEHLVRHGIWDYYEKYYGITNETGMYAMLTKIVEPNAKSPIKIYTDYVTNVLMARGFHPYVAPLIALRAVFDVTTASKTLLRTGLLNLIRENVEIIETAYSLMNHFFDVSVHVAYFDMYKQKWVQGWLNAPVRYLEPESKLLLLRSLMDKVILFQRNMFRAVLFGVRDYLVGINESINILQDYVTNVLDKYYSPLFTFITGSEMHLTWDAQFNDAIMKYFSVEQLIGTFRRIRYYARYALYRVLALIGMGLIPKEKIGMYVNELVDLMKETPQAKDVFLFISDLVYKRYLLRNYEVMARELLTRHAMTPDQVLQMLIKAGIDPDYAKAFVEAYAIPYYPTILELIVMSEYLPQALSQVGNIMALMRIPQSWQALWQSYTYVRAYVRYFIRELNELITLASTIPQSVKVSMAGKQIAISDITKKVLEEAGEFGFDSVKLNFIKAVIDMRYALREFHNSVPTPWHALNLSYYVPDPDKFLDNVFNYVIINDFGKSLIKTLAKFRRYQRWMWETVYWIVRAFARGYVDGQTVYQFLQSLKSYGLSDYDIDMIRNFAFAVSCYYGACAYPW